MIVSVQHDRIEEVFPKKGDPLHRSWFHRVDHFRPHARIRRNQDGKYLGLPAEWGKSTSEALGFVKQKITAKLQGNIYSYLLHELL